MVVTIRNTIYGAPVDESFMISDWKDYHNKNIRSNLNNNLYLYNITCYAISNAKLFCQARTSILKLETAYTWQQIKTNPGSSYVRKPIV